MAQQTENLNLDPGQFGELNRRFFREDRGPHMFLRHRLRGLFLSVTDQAAVAEAAANGLSLGITKMSFPSVPGTAEDDDVAEMAALEATILFHHTAETLIQLFLILEQHPPCPWLAIAQLKRQRGNGLARRVRDLENRWASRKTEDALVRVFFGRHAVKPTPDGISDPIWLDRVRGLRLLVGEAVRRFQREGDLYNSAKHGLSAVQGQAAVRVGNADNPILSAGGPSLTVLQVRDVGEPLRPTWHETTHWIDAASTVALIGLMTYQIENAWNVARFHYADGSSNLSPRWPEGEKIATLLRGEIPEQGYAITVPELSMPLAYRSAPDSKI